MKLSVQLLLGQNRSVGIEAPDEDRFAEGSRPDCSILSLADRFDLTSVRSLDDRLGGTIFSSAGVPNKGRVVGTGPDAVVLREHCLDGEAMIGKLSDQGKRVDVVKIDRPGSAGGPDTVFVLHHAVHSLTLLL